MVSINLLVKTLTWLRDRRTTPRVPAQRGGSRDSGPLPPSAAYLATHSGWRDQDLDEISRQTDFDLWMDCLDVALAPLQPELRRAWARASEIYRQRRTRFD